MAQAGSAQAITQGEKMVRNLPYSPQSKLVRGIYYQYILNAFALITEDNSNTPNRMASVQGTPEQVQLVTKTIQEIIEQVITK